MVVQQIVLCAWLICLNRTGPSGVQFDHLATRLTGHLTFAQLEKGRPPYCSRMQKLSSASRRTGRCLSPTCSSL